MLTKMEKTLEKIETSPAVSIMLRSAVESIMQEFGRELGITAGRIYEQTNSHYQLVSQIGEPQAPSGYTISMEYAPIRTLRTEGQLLMSSGDEGFDPTIEEPLHIKSFAAISLGDNDEYLISFSLSEPVDRPSVEYALTLIRHVGNLKIRHKRLESYIAEARKIQQSLLPTDFPSFYGFDIFGRSVPAEIVGGDIFDIITIAETIVGLAIADASGHGLPAALQVRDVFVGLRMGLAKDMKIVRTMEKLNSVLAAASKSHEFITLFYAELEDNGNFFYCNAGHPPALFFSSNNVYELTRGGLILGPYAKAKYERGFVFFEPGNVLVMYTDGITEAVNQVGDEFGTERIVQIVNANRSLSSKELCDAILAAVNEFTGSAPPKDDRTLLIVKK